MTRKLSRLIGVSTIATIAGLAIAATVSAHADVEADGDAIVGQPARLVFTVPNERPDQATDSIVIQMPQDVDLTDVVPEEVEGWTITTTTRDGDIVDTITWDAAGSGPVGEDSVELPIAVGPLPDVESLTFPTVQTYDDGEVVRWIEPAPPGEPEPERPVPTLEINAASPEQTTEPTQPTQPTEPSATDAPPPTEALPTPVTEATTPATDAVATPPTDTATATGATEISPSSTAVEAEDDDSSTVWWVVAGVIILVVVVVGGGTLIARRRTSG